MHSDSESHSSVTTGESKHTQFETMFLVFFFPFVHLTDENTTLNSESQLSFLAGLSSNAKEIKN
jgi:hypothetical protein